MAKKYQTNAAKFDDKGKLTEAFVQRVVRDKLNKLFYSAPAVYCAEEVYTTEGKKADVLLAFNRQVQKAEGNRCRYKVRFFLSLPFRKASSSWSVGVTILQKKRSSPQSWKS